MALTPAQLAHYHEHGYAVGGRLLDDAALAALTTEVDALVAGREKHVGGSGGPLEPARSLLTHLVLLRPWSSTSCIWGILSAFPPRAS